MMRLSRWSSVGRLLGFALIVLASCPFTAPFQPADLAAPIDSPVDGAAMLQAKNAVDDPIIAHACAPALFVPPGATQVRRLTRFGRSAPARLLQIPLRI
jgi:hypothetical protein